MNEELLAQAYKALNGDLNNAELPSISDKFLFYSEVNSFYICYNSIFTGNSNGCTYICTTEQFINYKGDNMKTVRDAVIVFKAEWPDFDGLLEGSSTAAIGCSTITNEVQMVGSECNVGLYFITCNESEFNTYVDLLSRHAGKELFQQYLAADKTLLEKEAKVDYTSEEFWKDELYSPYLCVIIDNKTGLKIWKRSLPTIDSGFYWFYGDSELYDGSESYAISRYAFIPRPQPKPVFTKEDRKSVVTGKT